MTRDLATTHIFQVRNIKTWISDMNDIFHSFAFSDDQPSDPDFSNKEIIEAKKKRFEFLANRVYNLCIAYFESKNLPFYATKFDDKIRPFFADRKTLLSSYFFIDEESSALTHTFELFLDSFPEFGSVEEKTGLDYLENILKSTALILEDKKIVPTNEAQVYNAVKVLCRATFPDGKFSPEPFNKTAKCYKPDILIPSLNCAIEYKYAENEKELARTIDEILIDVRGYSDHPIFNVFFAVFYVKSGQVIEERFKNIWNEKKFPKNWTGLIVLGS
jgi:hypothetical protein